MSGLNGGNDTLGAGEVFQGIYRLVVGDRNIFRPAGVVEPSVLRPDAGIVQTGGDGVNRRDLAKLVLAEVAFHTVEDAQPTGGHRGRGLKGIHAPACGLTADQPNAGILDKIVEGADGVAAAADAGDNRVRQLSLLGQHLRLISLEMTA